jgi:hypothetical protein
LRAGGSGGADVGTDGTSTLVACAREGGSGGVVTTAPGGAVVGGGGGADTGSLGGATGILGAASTKPCIGSASSFGSPRVVPCEGCLGADKLASICNEGAARGHLVSATGGKNPQQSRCKCIPAAATRAIV